MKKLDNVMERILSIAPSNITPEDTEFLRHDATRKLEDGWEPNDVVAFLCSTEEVNPGLSEDVALKRMNGIAKKYISIKKLDSYMPYDRIHA